MGICIKITADTALEHGYVSITPRFLRWRSDNDISGWMINSLIKLYQWQEDELIKDNSGLRNGHIFGVDITLSEENFSVPTLTVSQYRYEKDALLTWKRVPSVSEHWGFYYPTRNLEYIDIRNEDDYMRGIPRNNKAKAAYWNLDEVLFRKLELVPVNSKERIKEDIIGSFDFFRRVS